MDLRAQVRECVQAERDDPTTWPSLAAALFALWEEGDNGHDWLTTEKVGVGRSRGYLLIAIWDQFAGYDLTGLAPDALAAFVGPVSRGEVLPEQALKAARAE